MIKMVNSKTITVLASGALILLGYLAAKLGYQQPNLVLMVVAAAVAGYPIVKTAYTSIKFKIIGIEALVTVAAIGAIIIGEYWEAAAVTFLFALGSFLEAKTLDKTRQAIKQLMDMAPLTAIVLADGQEREIPADEVIPGDIVVIKPGAKIPVDGIVIKGHGTINEAHVTGEPMPVGKTAGDKVYSGTINEVGYMEVKTEKAGEDTTFARILTLVEEAQESKAPTERYLANFARYYTPGIILLSVIVFLFTRDIGMALTLLVIACPGALVIATPVSIVSAIGNGARRGVLLKGGEHLEKAGKVNVIAFDKTGTLTHGKPSVKEVKAFVGTSSQVLASAASVEAHSEHHLARAIVSEACNQFKPAEDFQVYPGKGASGHVSGINILVGNRALITEAGITIPAEVENYLQQQETAGCTAIIIAEGGQVTGVVSIADQLRSDAAEVIGRLKKIGIKAIMLTGDNPRTAAAIAGELGLDEYSAGLLPEQKVEVINKYMQQGNVIAMVGDGINDAPALATADIGVAMGAAGTDVTVEVANVILMADRLAMVPYAIGLSRAAVANIKQNIAFAIAVVLLLIAGVLGKYVFLASGMLVHEASVLLVILNAMRLLIYKPKSTNL